MEEKTTTKLKHTKILKAFLLVLAVASLYTFYNKFDGDYFAIVQSMQDSALILLVFMFAFIGFNIHLAGGDTKVKKVFDHLIFFGFLYYIFVYSVTLLDRLNSGTLWELSEDLQVTATSIILNHVIIIVLIPTIVMITLVWSVRNVRQINKGENKKGDSKASLFYYVFLLASVLGLIYSLLTPLYSIY